MVVKFIPFLVLELPLHILSPFKEEATGQSEILILVQLQSMTKLISYKKILK